MRRLPMNRVLERVEAEVREREGPKPSCAQALADDSLAHAQLAIEESSHRLGEGLRYRCHEQVVDGLYELAAACIEQIRILEAS